MPQSARALRENDGPASRPADLELSNRDLIQRLRCRFGSGSRKKREVVQATRAAQTRRIPSSPPVRRPVNARRLHLLTANLSLSSIRESQSTGPDIQELHIARGSSGRPDKAILSTSEAATSEIWDQKKKLFRKESSPKFFCCWCLTPEQTFEGGFRYCL